MDQNDPELLDQLLAHNTYGERNCNWEPPSPDGMSVTPENIEEVEDVVFGGFAA